MRVLIWTMCAVCAVCTSAPAAAQERLYEELCFANVSCGSRLCELTPMFEDALRDALVADLGQDAPDVALDGRFCLQQSWCGEASHSGHRIAVCAVRFEAKTAEAAASLTTCRQHPTYCPDLEDAGLVRPRPPDEGDDNDDAPWWPYLFLALPVFAGLALFGYWCTGGFARKAGSRSDIHTVLAAAPMTEAAPPPLSPVSAPFDPYTSAQASTVTTPRPDTPASTPASRPSPRVKTPSWHTHPRVLAKDSLFSSPQYLVPQVRSQTTNTETDSARDASLFQVHST
eukprot:TRINITY_DN2929_c3_g1_i1.p1 TRINITY_DN2929_c3_g1~~TRINITY_DN2929_c3_g1_i1.p1  ORF type:complete len:285 (+),score=30.17 TRINITY_DN2929_c3_g1_i1:30-884(+)